MYLLVCLTVFLSLQQHLNPTIWAFMSMLCLYFLVCLFACVFHSNLIIRTTFLSPSVSMLPLWMWTQTKQKTATVITDHARRYAYDSGLHECQLHKIAYEGDCHQHQRDVLLPQAVVTRRITPGYPNFLTQSESAHHVVPY